MSSRAHYHGSEIRGLSKTLFKISYAQLVSFPFRLTNRLDLNPTNVAGLPLLLPRKFFNSTHVSCKRPNSLITYSSFWVWTICVARYRTSRDCSTSFPAGRFKNWHFERLSLDMVYDLRYLFFVLISVSTSPIIWASSLSGSAGCANTYICVFIPYLALESRERGPSCHL